MDPAARERRIDTEPTQELGGGRTRGRALPLERATALEATAYLDAALARLERERVFARSWQLVAHTGELAEPGDHVVREIAGVPLLVLRGEDGALRALHNVCRHRAGPLAERDGRGARSLRCRYHGWSYGLDGRLRAAPEMQEAQDFDPRSIHLPQARVASCGPLVFAALADELPPLDELLAGIGERARPNGLETLVHRGRESYEIACNWKVYVDNYLEGYHLPHVHPGLSELLDYASYTTELARWSSLQHSPLESAASFYGEGPPGSGAFYWFVWPSTMLNSLPGRLQTNRVVPLGLERCRVDFDYYYPPGAADAQELARRERDRRFSAEIQAEDVAICEAVQRGLASGSYSPGRLSPRREAGVKHFQDLWRAALGAAWVERREG